MSMDLEMLRKFQEGERIAERVADLLSPQESAEVDELLRKLERRHESQAKSQELKAKS